LTARARFDGALYRRARRARKQTPATVSKRSGYSESYITAVERGYRNPTLDGLVALCDALDIPVYVVLTREPVQ